MHGPPHDYRAKAHKRTYSTPIVMAAQHKRKSSITTQHQLLRIHTHNLHLAAPAVVNLTRLDSQSLASFTPYSESTNPQGPASGSLRAHMHVLSQSLISIPKRADSPDAGTNIVGIEISPSRQRPRLFSLFEFSTTTAAVSLTTSPVALDVEVPFSGSPPSSPSMSIPSISRTHSSTASSSLPRTPPLPLPPISLRMKKRSRDAMPGYEGRKRAPSLPIPPVHRRLNSSPSRHRTRERTFSAYDRTNTRRLDCRPTSRSRSPECTPRTPRSNSPTSPQSLVELEASSKFMRKVATCAICGLSGPDYPRCPGCGDAWCSRACRMIAKIEAGGGEGTRGHGCKGKRAIPR